MKFLSRFAIAIAFSLGCLGAQATPMTFDEMTRVDLYQLVSTAPRQVANDFGLGALGNSSQRQASVSWSAGSAAVVPPNELAASAVATPIPEPQTYALMLAGIGMMTMVALRRRSD